MNKEITSARLTDAMCDALEGLLCLMKQDTAWLKDAGCSDVTLDARKTAMLQAERLVSSYHARRAVATPDWKPRRT